MESGMFWRGLATRETQPECPPEGGFSAFAHRRQGEIPRGVAANSDVPVTVWRALANSGQGDESRIRHNPAFSAA